MDKVEGQVATVSVKTDGAKSLSLSWGDGTREDVKADKTLTHTYPEAVEDRRYHVVLSGEKAETATAVAVIAKARETHETLGAPKDFEITKTGDFWFFNAKWEAPDEGTPVKYRLYVLRGDIEGDETGRHDVWYEGAETSVLVDLDQAQKHGAAPSRGNHTLAVVAVDADGKESAPSNTQTLDVV